MEAVHQKENTERLHSYGSPNTDLMEFKIWTVFSRGTKASKVSERCQSKDHKCHLEEISLWDISCRIMTTVNTLLYLSSVGDVECFQNNSIYWYNLCWQKLPQFLQLRLRELHRRWAGKTVRNRRPRSLRWFFPTNDRETIPMLPQQ